LLGKGLAYRFLDLLRLSRADFDFLTL
jgi:hypothetical protein